MGYYPVPKYVQDDETATSQPDTPASDSILQDFLAALQAPAPATPVEAPGDLSVGDRIYYALKGARDPQFRKTVVEPMLAERASFPQRKAAAAQADRAARLKELGAAYTATTTGALKGAQAAAVPGQTEAKLITAQAARDKVAAAIKKGGKIRYLIERDSAGNPVNAGYVEDTDENGTPILRRIEMVGPGEGGEEVRTLGTPRPVPGKVITDETGAQKLINPNTGAEIKPQGFRQPSPGIQTSAARAVSTIAGFNDLRKVYDEYQKSQLGASPSLGSRLLTQARGAAASKFPGTAAVLDPATTNFVRARRAALNRYIKDVTGAQFSIKELERYESQLPGPGEGPETALPAIQALVNQSLEQLRAFIRQNGGLKAMISDPALQAKLASETDFSAFSADPNNPTTQKWLNEGTPQADLSAMQSSAPAGLPPGVPAGSTRAGISKKTGRPIWRSPDGKLWME